MRVFILIAGRAGVGKDTSAKELATLLLKSHPGKVFIYHFATELKKFARSLGWDGNKDAKGRKLLQDLGKVGREYNIDTWVKFMVDSIPELPKNSTELEFIIVPDWRFVNELTYIKERFLVFTMRIESPEREMLKGTPLYDDVSETSLPPAFTGDLINYDTVVNNLGTVEELRNQLAVVASHLTNTLDLYYKK